MEEENDSTRQIEQFKLKINEKSFAHQCLLDYLGISAGEINQKNQTERKSEKVFKILQEQLILTNKYEFSEFLKTISHLWEMHQPKRDIKDKIENLLTILKKDIKNIFLEEEIFNIFHFYKNNFILLILVEQNILSIETMIRSISIFNDNDMNIIKYFYPEIKHYNKNYFKELRIKYGDSFGLNQFSEMIYQNLGLFYEIRKEGEKEPKNIELIKEDKIEEFILFVEYSPIDLNEKIQKEKTILETDTEKLTPVECSALFGAISIFKYLCMKKVEINVINRHGINSIIEYAIQGRNYEIIHHLEERKEIIEELNNQKNQQKYLEVSIKMHYNEIFEYLISNYNYKITEEIIKSIIKFGNYHLLEQLIERNQIEIKNKATITNIFQSFCGNGDEEIVKILINQPNLDINSKDNILMIFLKRTERRRKRWIEVSSDIHCY